jgi:hypothetical protein
MPEGSAARFIRCGLGGPKPRARAVGDGARVITPVLPSTVISEAGTSCGNTSVQAGVEAGRESRGGNAPGRRSRGEGEAGLRPRPSGVGLSEQEKPLARWRVTVPQTDTGGQGE